MMLRMNRTMCTLLAAAARNVLSHLIDLASRNLASADPAPGADALWHPG